jgi:hypothetical protein
MNHRGLQFFTDQTSRQVHLLRLPLNPQYSRYLEIDFVLHQCQLSCRKDGQDQIIQIPRQLEPDFPHLTKLREIIELFVTFS